MVQGSRSAVGAAALNRPSWNRDRASAMSLDTPGTWCALTKKLCFMEVRVRNLRSIMRGALEWPELMIATTDSLSHQNCRRFPAKWGYQIAQATTMPFLPFNAYPFVFAKCQVGRPPSLEPFPIEVPAEPNGTSSIGKQFHVGRRGNEGVEEKGATIPPSKQSFPQKDP